MLTNEIVNSIDREISISKNAIDHLKRLQSEMETKYNINTETFVEKFNSGLIGDDEDYFVWYSYHIALKEWKKTRSDLKKLLNE